MTDNSLNSFLSSSLLLSVIIGGCVLLLMYIIRMLKNDNQQDVDVDSKNVKKPSGTSDKHSFNIASSKSKNKKPTETARWTGRSDKHHNYTHPWLLTSLKGHTGQVVDMDFSSNGKYLASCAEEPDPGGEHEVSSGSESNKENSRPLRESMNEPASPSSNQINNKVSGLSRRQRKNRRREDSSPPETKKKSKTKRSGGGGGGASSGAGGGGGGGITNGGDMGRRTIHYTPLKQYTKLQLNEQQLSTFLRTYLLCAEQMLALGYPIESDLHPGRAIIFKSPMTAASNYNPYKASRFDVNAQEFVPQVPTFVNYTQIKQEWCVSHGDVSSSLDSGLGASSSSSDSSDAPEEDNGGGSSSDQDPTVKCSGGAVRDHGDACVAPSEERQCVRCGNGFFVASDGEYLTHEHCVYHWGKLQRIFSVPVPVPVPVPALHNQHNQSMMAYTCCGGRQGTTGCTVGKLHVWNGVGVGFNGPFDSYMRTRPRKTPPPDGMYGVYALDCEMCYTVGGLELTKVTVVGADGRLVYDCFVRPENDIVDYNTRFSGITARDLNRKSVTKTLRDVQNDLMGFINADTILVGHGLENDLRALRIMHCTVVDTAVTFPHYNGLPYRRSLKTLTSCFLKRDIQCSSSGHNSCEDARACMELMLWKVRKDFRQIIEHYTMLPPSLSSTQQQQQQ